MIKNIIIKFIRKWFCPLVEVSIADLLLSRGDCPSGIQFTVASRFLDITAYFEGDESFYFQNLFTLAGNPNHDIIKGNNRFKDLINDFLKNGYRQTPPPIIVNNTFDLVDGTHRVAMCMYLKQYIVQVQVIPTKAFINYPDDIYKYQNVMKTEIDKCIDAFKLIQHALLEQGCGFGCLIEGDIGLRSSFVRDLSAFVFLYNSIQSKNSQNREMMVFSLKDPQYFIDNKRLVSKRITRIEEVFKARYKDRRVQFFFSKNCTDGKKMYDDFINDMIDYD